MVGSSNAAIAQCGPASVLAAPATTAPCSSLRLVIPIASMIADGNQEGEIRSNLAVNRGP